MLIQRDTYLNKLIERQNNGMVKVITGIRRCGKSFLLFKLHMIFPQKKKSNRSIILLETFPTPSRK